MAPKKRSPSFSTRPQSSTSSRHQLDQHTPSHLQSTELPDPAQLRHSGIAPQPLTSSYYHSSFQATPVDPALQPHLPAIGSPVPSSEGTAPESISRRQSTSSTMHTSSLPLEGHPTSTPTGRISKAKKGKRVHACAYEGCGKVGTDAPEDLCHCTNSLLGLHQSGAQTET